MIKLHYKICLMLITAVTALCILFLGMRVPDFSRPYRPKPTHRAFIEKHVKTFQHSVKKCFEAAVLAKPAALDAAAPYGTQCLFSYSFTGFPPLFPNLSRAPPLLPA